MKKVTISDIATKAHVSKSTVSKALSNSTDISDDLRDEILAIAKDSGYVIKRYKKKSKGQILTYVGNVDIGEIGMFGYQVLFGFQSSANVAGYSIWLVSERDVTDEKFKELINSHDYNSVFMMGIGSEDPKLEMVRESNKPCVLLDNYIDSDNACEVMTDSKLGINQCINYLIELGHKDIALFSGNANSAITIDRKSAYEIAIRNSGLEYRPQLVTHGDFCVDLTESEIPQLLAQGVTAILCMSDKMAVETIEYLKKQRIRVPEDISVIGFDDSSIASTTNPPLTTVRQDGVEIGKVAYSSLRLMMKGTKIARVTMRPELIIRKSTGLVGIKKFY